MKMKMISVTDEDVIAHYFILKDMTSDRSTLCPQLGRVRGSQMRVFEDVGLPK